jgi:hypothetical protein
MFPCDRVAQLYPHASGSFSVLFYNSQGYGGGIRIHLHKGVYKCVHFVTVYGHWKRNASFI